MSALSIWILSFAAVSLVWFSVWWFQLMETKRLRGICRRVAEHLSNEHHIGLKDPATNAELIAELESAGWTENGEER